MNTAFSAAYSDGVTLASRRVEVLVEAGRLHLAGPGLALDFPLAAVRASGRLGRVPRFIYLPNHGTLETDAHEPVDALAGAPAGGLPGWLEARAWLATSATVCLTVIIATGVYLGLPALAQRAAQAVPASVEQQAGRTALVSFNRYLAPSQLDAAERRRIQGLLTRLVPLPDPGRPITIEFRSMGGKYPNAFALPGGIIVISDELVKLAADEGEMMAVLAHEIGHIQRRHGLQSVLRNSAALLLVSTVTGDLSTVTSFAGAIPLTLLQRGYSREFEAEADADAVELLRRARVDVAHFAVILKKLEGSRPAAGQDYSYLSTHPATADRIGRINPDGHLPPKTAFTPTAPSPNALAAAAVAPSEPEEEIVPLAGTDHVKPRGLAQPPPLYPAEMAKAGLEGQVTVEFIIGRDGLVHHPRIVRSTYKEFEAPAIAAVLQWKFTPARVRGKTVATRVSQILEFNLADSPLAAPAEENPATRKFTLKP